MTYNLTWDEFKAKIKDVLEISNKLNDKWELEVNNEDVGGTFLRYKQMKSFESRIFSFDYHVLYSISYSVPMFYFNVQETDTGQLLTLEAFRKLFVDKNALELLKQEDLNQILTQMEHPLLFRPFLALHPCKTQDVLAQTDNSENKILTFISTYGPFIFLNLDLQYGK